MRYLLIPAAALVLAACQPDDQPGSASDTPTADVAAPTTPDQPAPPAYVGAWAADSTWCANTIGPERPIVLTATEFRGYENTCQITDLQPVDADWTATFVCQAEGETTRRPTRIAASDERLQINWLDEGYAVEWRRCPT